MLTISELKIYRNELIEENGIQIPCITLIDSINVSNKPFTSELTPKSTKSIKQASWIYQWKALSSTYWNRFHCASCGKPLFADVSDMECQKLAKAYKGSSLDSNCTPETFQVVGGHIVLEEDIHDNHYYLAHKGDTFIVPLCKECNNYRVGFLMLKPHTVITPEIR